MCCSVYIEASQLGSCSVGFLHKFAENRSLQTLFAVNNPVENDLTLQLSLIDILNIKLFIFPVTKHLLTFVLVFAQR